MLLIQCLDYCCLAALESLLPLVRLLAGLLALHLLLLVLEHGADHRRSRLDLLCGAEIAGLNHHRPLRLPALVLGREFLLKPSYACIILHL